MPIGLTEAALNDLLHNSSVFAVPIQETPPMSNLSAHVEQVCHDCNQKFANSYVRILDGAKKIWAHVVEFWIEDYVVVVRYQTDKVYQCAISDIEIDTTIPPAQAVNFHNSVSYFYRKQQRQWRRGVTPGTAGFHSIFSLAWSKVIHQTLPSVPVEGFKDIPKFNTGDLSEVFDSVEEIPWEVMYGKLKTGKFLGRALEGDFYLTCGIGGKVPTLWKKSVLVGFLHSPDTFECRVPFPQLFEELPILKSHSVKVIDKC